MVVSMKFGSTGASFTHLGDPCPLPNGTRIVLVTMPHDPDPIPRGTKGTVTGGNGEQIWVSWDNGRATSVWMSTPSSTASSLLTWIT
jgi:hypothetical protein